MGVPGGGYGVLRRCEGDARFTGHRLVHTSEVVDLQTLAGVLGIARRCTGRIATMILPRWKELLNDAFARSCSPGQKELSDAASAFRGLTTLEAQA